MSREPLQEAALPDLSAAAVPENTQAIEHSFGYGVGAQPSMLDPTERRGHVAPGEVPKGPQRFHFPPVLLAGLAVTFVGLLAWWVIDEPDTSFPAPVATVPRAASLTPAPPPPEPPRVVEPPKAPAPPVVASPPPPPARPRRKPSKPKVVREEKPLPPSFVRNLSGPDIRDALRKSRTLIHRHCEHPSKRVSVNADLSVLPNGTVTSVRVAPPFDQSKLARCIVRYAKQAKFPVRARTVPSQVHAAFHVGGPRRVRR